MSKLLVDEISDADNTGPVTVTDGLIGDVTGTLTGNVTGNLTGNVTGAINGFTPQASNMQPFNRIINGAMTIAQRGGAATGVSSQTYVLDRWNAAAYAGATCTVEQSTTAPTGFVNSLKYTVTTGATTDPTDYNDIRQNIEGQNLADLGWGTASAKTVTLSFWVRSSLTGTFAVSFLNSGYDSYYPASYIINSTDTWEYKTVTVAGPTSGTWLTTNGVGMRVVWDLGVGSTYSRTLNTWGSTYAGFGGTGVVKLAATTGATFYITGVQLEAGSTASSFAHEFVGDTLRKCQRYYEILNIGTNHGEITAGTGYGGVANWMVPKRVAATVVFLANISNSAGFPATTAGFSNPSNTGFMFGLGCTSTYTYGSYMQTVYSSGTEL